MNPFEIVVVGPRFLDDLLVPVEDDMRRRGLKVTRFLDAGAVNTHPEAFKSMDVLFAVGLFPCTRDLMMGAPKLRAVISPFTGTEGFDERAATELGIVVGNGQTRENYESMAEAGVMLILMSLYDVHRTERVLRENLPRPHESELNARMLRGKTVGLVGFGKIGRTIAAKLQNWGVTLQAAVRRTPADAPPYVTIVPLDDLLATSDIVVVAVDLNATTRGLLNAERLERIKQGAIIVNICRGHIIDEAALVRLMKAGRLTALALDAFDTVPLPPDHPLRELPRTILTPTIVGHTQETTASMPVAAVENIMRVLSGDPPLYIRNPEVIPAWRKRFAKSL
jgi:phosphoglycerate dehydrogenase-like enzyme